MPSQQTVRPLPLQVPPAEVGKGLIVLGEGHHVVVDGFAVLVGFAVVVDFLVRVGFFVVVTVGFAVEVFFVIVGLAVAVCFLVVWVTREVGGQAGGEGFAEVLQVS